MGDADPIAQLVDALRRDGKPPLAWVVRWSQGGREPVAAAWAESGLPHAMIELLRSTASSPESQSVLALADEASRRTWQEQDLFPERDCGSLAAEEYAARMMEWRRAGHRACADAVRALVPAPPTLAELLAARRA